MNIRILLADDHLMVRELLCHVLRAQSDLEVVAQTGDGLEVIPLARATAPHIVCMDISMPGMNGIEVTRTLLQEWPMIKVVALSGYTDQRHVLDMLNAGASAYVTKVEASTELISAIRAVLRGRTYLCPDVAGVVADELLDRNGRARSSVVLGKREREVLKLVAHGHTSNEIAASLLIAASTVDVHRRNIMRKLDRHGVAELTRYVIDNDLDDRDS
ncbi:MAG: response regulator transcription factor [Betaproteobacteria bacterium]